MSDGTHGAVRQGGRFTVVRQPLRAICAAPRQRTIAARLLYERFERFRRHRLCKIVALCQRTAERIQPFHLPGRLQPFAEHRHVQLIRHADDIAQDYIAFIAFRCSARNKAAVQLQDIKLQFLEQVERGIACAEIVNGYLAAQCAQAADYSRRLFHGFRQHGLCQLEFH